MNTGEQFQLSDEAAERYERCPARYILGPWAPLLVNAARPTAGERVLDVACGTGVVASKLKSSIASRKAAMDTRAMPAKKKRKKKARL